MAVNFQSIGSQFRGALNAHWALHATTLLSCDIRRTKSRHEIMRSVSRVDHLGLYTTHKLIVLIQTGCSSTARLALPHHVERPVESLPPSSTLPVPLCVDE